MNFKSDYFFPSARDSCFARHDLPREISPLIDVYRSFSPLCPILEHWLSSEFLTMCLRTNHSISIIPQAVEEESNERIQINCRIDISPANEMRNLWQSLLLTLRNSEKNKKNFLRKREMIIMITKHWCNKQEAISGLFLLLFIRLLHANLNFPIVNNSK